MSELIEIPKIPDARGNLSFIENGDRLPFVMERCYWIYDVPGGEVRHGHAFRRQHEMIVAESMAVTHLSTGNIIYPVAAFHHKGQPVTIFNE